MKNTKIINLLRKFSENELKDFRKFVDSPFFNKEGKYVLRFYDEIRKYYPEFTDLNLERKNIFEKLYPGKFYDDVIMRKLSSSLQRLAEEYLNYVFFRSSGYAKDLMNLRMLRERRLVSQFELKAQDLETSFTEKKHQIDIDYFRNRFRLETEKINYYMDFNSLVKQQQNSLQKIQGYIVYDALINILDIAYNILVGLNTMYSGKANVVLKIIDILDLESVSAMLKKESPDLFPVFELFYLRYLSMLKFDEETYRKYKKAAFKNLDLYNRENRFTIMVSLQNFCITKFVKGERKFAYELHEIHKEMLKMELLINETNGYMNMNSFRNIILTAQYVGKYSWMEKFIRDYEKSILPEQRESLSAWAKASFHYSNGNFKEALKELQSVKNDHFLTKHDIKLLLMKIFYELKDYETAISFADTYRKMVENDKTYSDIHKNSHKKFAIFYSKFIKLVANNNYSELPFLRSEVEKAVCNSKEWLIEKMNIEIKKPDSNHLRY